MYEIYHASFPWEVYCWSGRILKGGSKIINDRPKVSMTEPSPLFTETAQTIVKACLFHKHIYCQSSHQQHRACCAAFVTQQKFVLSISGETVSVGAIHVLVFVFQHINDTHWTYTSKNSTQQFLRVNSIPTFHKASRILWSGQIRT